MTPWVVLDNEAVQALRDRAHRKHRRAVTLLEGTEDRGGRAISPVVPTAVRVEAGWDRQDARAAAINRLDIDDVPLDATASDRAVRLRRNLDLSVADAHIGAVLQSSPGPWTVLTSDVDDIRRIAAHLDVRVNVVAL